MPTFDFQGTDVTATTPNYGASIGSGSVNLSEQGVAFTFSITGPTAGTLEVPEDDAFNDAISAREPTFDSQMSFTMDLAGTAGQQFFSDFNMSVVFVSGTWTMQLIQDQTTGGATIAPLVLTTLTVNSTGNFAVPTTGLGGEYQFNSIKFTHSTGGVGSLGTLAIDSITTEINCFLPGTMIATADGQAPVEVLKPGDMVLTGDGRTVPVRWVGEQPVNVRLSHPTKVNPVCITAGALGGGLPERDLYLSQDHAIALDGLLINAGALVNGRTIYQLREMPLDGFTYYHVETDAHELILAEGVPAESFIDYLGRDSFDNAAEATPRTIPEMDLPRVSSARQVPPHIRTRLTPAIAAE